MIDRSGNWFPLLLLIALAGLTFWLDRIVQPPEPGRRPMSGLDPDYIVDGLSAVKMDAQGRVAHALRAQKMTHYPDEDLTVLVEPKFVAYVQGQAPVTITSREARMSGNGEDVYFERDVRIVRAPFASSSELVVETSFLHVIPEAKIAKTDRPVTIRDANAVVVASGLELNSETRVLKLEGRVKGTFSERGPRGASDAR
ncbi:MAG: LPS export ABC transporter periplasmic protein LptC [Burkholderiales bacterium]